jgi:hypothetical protein
VGLGAAAAILDPRRVILLRLLIFEIVFVEEARERIFRLRVLPPCGNLSKTTPNEIQSYVNKIHLNLAFTSTQEEKNSISYIDLSISRQTQGIEIGIYRKPTTTDTTINFSSNHPMEHKMAAYRYLINRMTTLPLSTTQKEAEWQTVLKIANSNGFPTSTIKRLRMKMDHKTTTENNQHDIKWASFTYHSPSIRKITNLFKQTNKHQNILQKHQHNPPKIQTKKKKHHTRLRTKGHIRTNMQNMPKDICWTNLQKSRSQIPRTHTIHQEQ